MDIQSFLIGLQAGKNAGGDTGGDAGGGGTLHYMNKYVSGITNTWKYRVSIDFGFKPDLIVVLPYDMTTSSGQCAYAGCSTAFASAMGISTFSFYSYVRNNSSKGNSFSYPIDTNDENAPIFNADETGFNFGKSPSAGSAYVYAIGL